jgi:tetratricopeptide (TPR) repeat protein
VLVNLIATRAELGAHPELDADVETCLAMAETMQSARVKAMCLRSAAQAAVAQGLPELALERLASSVALSADGSASPASIRARLALTEGRALLALGRLEEAERTLREGLAVCEEDAEALQILAWQLHAALGQLAANRGGRDAALHHQHEALRILDAMGVGDSAAADALRSAMARTEP